MDEISPEPNGTAPSFGFRAADMEPALNALAWREAIATLFEAEDLAADADGTFRADLQSYAMGPVVCGLARAGGQRFIRSPQTIARSGVDHILVQLYQEGGYDGRAGEVPIRVRAGDVCVLDLSQTLDTRATAFQCLNLVVPRLMIEARLAQPELLHGLVLPRESVLAGLLGRHLEALLACAPRMTADECQALAEGTVGLVVACLRGMLERRDAALSGTAAPSLMRVRRYIEDRLADPGLSAETVASHFGMSRASIYRLFSPLGGVAGYIRARRLHRALFDLASDGDRAGRVGEIARRWSLGSEASFTRAFKLAYGITPRAAREAARLGGLPAGFRPSDEAPALTRWMREIAPRRDAQSMPAPDGAPTVRRRPRS